MAYRGEQGQSQYLPKYQSQKTGFSLRQNDAGGLRAQAQIARQQASADNFWTALNTGVKGGQQLYNAYQETLQKRYALEFDTAARNAIREHEINTRTSLQGANADNAVDLHAEALTKVKEGIFSNSKLSQEAKENIWNGYAQSSLDRVATHQMAEGKKAHEEAKDAAKESIVADLADSKIGAYYDLQEALDHLRTAVYEDDERGYQQAAREAILFFFKNSGTKDASATLKHFKANEQQLRDMLGKTYPDVNSIMESIQGQLEQSRYRQQQAYLLNTQIQAEKQRQRNAEGMKAYGQKMFSDEPFQHADQVEAFAKENGLDVMTTNLLMASFTQDTMPGTDTIYQNKFDIDNLLVRTLNDEIPYDTALQDIEKLYGAQVITKQQRADALQMLEIFSAGKSQGFGEVYKTGTTSAFKSLKEVGAKESDSTRFVSDMAEMTKGMSNIDKIKAYDVYDPNSLINKLTRVTQENIRVRQENEEITTKPKQGTTDHVLVGELKYEALTTGLSEERLSTLYKAAAEGHVSNSEFNFIVDKDVGPYSGKSKYNKETIKLARADTEADFKKHFSTSDIPGVEDEFANAIARAGMFELQNAMINLSDDARINAMNISNPRSWKRVFMELNDPVSMEALFNRLGGGSKSVIQSATSLNIPDMLPNGEAVPSGTTRQVNLPGDLLPGVEYDPKEVERAREAGVPPRFTGETLEAYDIRTGT